MDNYEPLGPPVPPPPPPPGIGASAMGGAKIGGSNQPATDLNSAVNAPPKVGKAGGKKKGTGKKKGGAKKNKSNKSLSKSVVPGTAEKKDGGGEEDEEDDEEEGGEEEDPNDKKKDPTAKKRKICYIVTGIMFVLSLVGMITGGALMAIPDSNIP